MYPGKNKCGDKCGDSGRENVKVDEYFSSIDSSIVYDGYEPLSDEKGKHVICKFRQFQRDIIEVRDGPMH